MITADVPPAHLRGGTRPRRQRSASAGYVLRCWRCCWRPPCCTCGRSAQPGWANDYYAAAVQAGTQDWKAWLFGSLDAGNAITVDKPPAALWVMVLSGRIFGFSAFTMLLPQALMGVGAVAVLYATVRRCSGPAAGLIAGAVARADPGRGADVPVQQPGRAAGAADGGGRLLRGAGHRDGQYPLDRVGGLCHGLRLPDQDAAGVPGRPRLRAGVPGRGSRRGVEARRQARRRRRRDDRLGRLVRRAGQSVACRVQAVHRRLVRQQPVATGVGLQRD